MESGLGKSIWKQTWVKFLFFAVSMVVVLYFFPREGKFKYQFSEGKPWRYGLLTAPFDFPIYKAEDLLAHERDSIMAQYKPYYRVNPAVGTQQIERLRADYSSHLHLKCSTHTMRYIEGVLREAYDRGIVDGNEASRLRESPPESIFLVLDKVAKSVLPSRLQTVKEVYKMVVEEAPQDVSRSELAAADINQYIVENVSFDETASDQARVSLLQSVSSSKGMVQVGEKIIDRGEIVTPGLFEILNSFKAVSERKSEFTKQRIWVICGQAIVVVLLLLSLFFYLYLFRRKLLDRSTNLVFILSCILFTILFTEMVIRFQAFSIYIIPYAILPILIRTFFDSRTALFTHNVTVLICAFMAPAPFEFVLLQIAAGMTAIHSLKDLTQRSQLVKSAFLIMFTYSAIYIGDTLITDGDWQSLNGRMFTYFSVNGILIMFSYLLMYIVERIFGYTSNVTLVELSNVNNPIFRQFSEKCPGSFQHSLQVANLAAEAANEIGAYVQLARTGALYHDIGKLETPSYFTENQTAGYNPHSELDFDESAQIIISHVPNGVKIADKLQLPNSIKGFIRSHHGTGKAKYFYNSFKNKYPDREIDESKFTYPGPNPYSRETAIVMMADAVEAISRSLSEYTEQSISEMVHATVDTMLNDGLFKNAPITLKEIERVKAVLIGKLVTMHHTRISYPKLKKTD